MIIRDGALLWMLPDRGLFSAIGVFKVGIGIVFKRGRLLLISLWPRPAICCANVEAK